ncbi:MAG TPA: nucleotide exchange factor GrpE [Devosiaceae bacterium]|nr:nucleotide exchange factor GrpE [Devosiaceae bacterium]
MTNDDDTSADDIGEETEPAAAGVADPQADLQADLQAENDGLKDQLLRAVAEMDNLRKRTAREIQESRLYSIAGFARDMLTATDNLSRALGALPQEERQRAEGTLKALIEGVELTEREMQRLLEKHGISKIEARGARFDPHFHQAMFEVAETDAPDNTVVDVVQDGYVIGERVLRPAMVGVARPAGKPDANADAGETAAGDGEGGIDKTV